MSQVNLTLYSVCDIVQPNNHEMHMDNHVDFLLDNFQKLFFMEVVLFVWFFTQFCQVA